MPTADQRVVMHDVSWEALETLLAIKGDAPSPRIAYLDGELELMSPSRDHERLKSTIGCLIEAYALERGVDFTPYGGWLLKQELKKAGIEPDECYVFGTDQDQPIPDLAIEIVWTSGGLRKLDIYQRLGVPEVWRWKKGRVVVWLLEGDAYVQSPNSRALPELDVEQLVSFLDRPTTSEAIRAYREALRTL